MPSKKKKYNSRFPPARIKKIMQSDEEVGKVAQVVPIIISKALEIFVASLLRTSSDVTRSRSARTLTPNHIKASILSEDQFHFLRDLAQTIPDVNPTADEEEGDVSVTPGVQTTVPRLQRKLSQNKSSTTLSHTSTTTTTTARARGRPRKRPLDSQTSLSSVKDEEEEEEEEDDDDTEVDEEAEDEEEERPVAGGLQSIIDINVNNNNNNVNNPYSTHSVSKLSSVLIPIPCSSTSTSQIGSKLPQIDDEDDDYDN